MKFKFKYLLIVEGCLGLLLVAAIGNSFMLTVGEGVRLLAIVVGLSWLYLIHGRNGQEIDADTATLRYGVSVLALILMFVLVQFDPSFARINELVTQERMNWFFVLSTTIVLVGFLISLVSSFFAIPDKRLKAWTLIISKSWSGFDRTVLSTIFVVIAFILLTELIFPDSAGKNQTFGIIKLGLCLLTYLSVLLVYRLPSIDKSENSDLVYPKNATARLKVAYKAVLGVFLLIVLLGGLKYILAWYEAGKGDLLIKEGKYEEAIAVLESALKKKGYYSEDLNVALGHAYLGIGQQANAEKHFALARRTEINSRTVDKSIGDVYSNLGIWDKAITVYRQARSNNPDPLYVIDQLSMAYLKNRDRMRVIELIKKYNRVPILRLNAVPDIIEFGICLIYTGYFTSATQQFHQALQLDVNSSMAYYGQGLLNNKKGEWEKARKNLKKALEIDPTLVGAHYELGVAYQNLDQIRVAMDSFKRALDLQPEHLFSLGQLASLYAMEGKLQRAEEMKQSMRLVIAPSQWEGPHGGSLAWSGNCWYETELFRGEIEITVKASGTPASDIWPIMEIFLNEQKVGAVSVVREGVYTFKTDVGENAYHKLVVAYINDSSSYDVGDRNLFVGQMEVRYLKVD
tara:strand:+ start:1783 stop:3669 length:1887 start_codon:yes stop_codon:yes gene_type:complete